MYEGPGIYRHYKGGNYEVMGLAFAESGKDRGFRPTDCEHQVVVYRPLTPGSMLDDTDVIYWLRPLIEFDEEVNIDPGYETDPPGMTAPLVPRFRMIGKWELPIGRILSAETNEPLALAIETLSRDTHLDPKVRQALLGVVQSVQSIRDGLLASLNELDMSSRMTVDSGDAPTLKG